MTSSLVVCFFTLLAVSQVEAFSYFLLAQFYPPTLGNDSFPFFSLHGLWPQNTPQKWPQWCHPKIPLNISEIEYLLPEMEMWWKTFESQSSNQHFWSHEWEKHGTCSLNVFPTQFDYFFHALVLRELYDLNRFWELSGLQRNQTYSYYELLGRMKEYYRVRLNLVCSEENPVLIQRGEVCLNKTNLIPFDCPMISNCEDQVELPSYKLPAPSPGPQPVPRHLSLRKLIMLRAS